jgi:hypothetical protein
VAQTLGVPFVPIRDAFERELRAQPDLQLFAPDSHCNDRGYGLLAATVAEAIALRLGR